LRPNRRTHGTMRHGCATGETTMTNFLIVLLLATDPLTHGRATPRRCSAVEFTATLSAGDSFRRKLDDLVFRVKPTKDKGFCYGWIFTLEDAAGHDFIYPVNPPLRLNPLQFLGCSYGLTAQQSLEMSRSLRFLLSESDYLQLDPLVMNALWPGDAPDPEHAAERYLQALGTVNTGILRLKVVHFEVSADGSVRSAQLKVEFVAPSSFHFDPALKPYPATCPARSAQ